MKELTFVAADETATRELGLALASVLPRGAVVALIGTLGAGKTRLVQALAEGAGAKPGTAVSPTFVLVGEYRTDPPIYHFDAYRLRDEDEFMQLGPDEYFEGEGICVVEWADRVEDCLPGDRLEIEIAVKGEQKREMLLRATGALHQAVVQGLADRLGHDGQ